MFYHIKVETTDDKYLIRNQLRDVVLTQYVCPYLNQEITLYRNVMYNMAHLASLKVFKTDRPIDSDWPIKKSDWDELNEEHVDDVFMKVIARNSALKQSFYEAQLRQQLEIDGTDITAEIFAEAITLIDKGEYKDLRRRLADSHRENYSFFICPFGNDEVDHNYEMVIKPAVEKYQFTIFRADEISHTRQITDVIIDSIVKAKFVIADLTDSRPNCYYEVGFAQSLSKPVIILAKEGTERHFDISTYKWNYWKTYKDLKPLVDKELSSLLKGNP
jgi:hypothetical protein